jgi:putative N-acetylmannosamine-6-phosphate epimerase
MNNNFGDIKTIFTSEDLNHIKNAMKNIIIGQFKNDLERYDRYLVNPSDIEDLIQESYIEIIDEIKKEVKSKMKKRLTSHIEKHFNIE